MRRALAVPAGLGLLLLAFGVAYSTPDDPQVQAPFVVTGGVGDEIVSQHLVVTVHEVSLAREVELDLWRGTTSGVWLVVDATAQARVERSNLAVDVYVDGVRYPASGRPGFDTLDAGVADAGFPVSGAVLVELPAGIQDHPGARSATLRFGQGLDVRLDSVIELDLDLTALGIADRAQVDTARAGER